MAFLGHGSFTYLFIVRAQPNFWCVKNIGVPYVSKFSRALHDAHAIRATNFGMSYVLYLPKILVCHRVLHAKNCNGSYAPSGAKFWQFFLNLFVFTEDEFKC